MKNPKDDIEIEVMEAFTSKKSDQEIGMPNIDQELMKLKAKRNHHKISTFRKLAALIAIILAVSGIAVAAIVNHQTISNFFALKKEVTVEQSNNPTTVFDELQITPSDTVIVKPGVIVFDEAELAEIMTHICNTYKKEVVFKNEELKHLHLHFQYNTEDKLDDVLKNLNMFEKINVELNDNKLEVE